jgi:predicted permease
MVRLYRFALRLLPPGIRAKDGPEMVWAFAMLWAAAPGGLARVRLVVRCFGRLPLVAALEWLELMGWVRAPGSGSNVGRWGMSAWMSSLRYVFRTLWKAPAFTATTVILLGLGVGSVTTIFTLVDHVLLRALPYPAQERIISVDNGSHPVPVFREFQTINSVELWGAAISQTARLVGQGDPQRITETRVSEDFFSLFGARPANGRLLVEEDFAASDVVVLGHGTWERVFGSDPDIVGQTIRVDDEAVQVVGVLDQEFVAPEGLVATGTSPDLWRPMDWGRPEFDSIDYWVLDVMGRLASGATLADANAELTRVSERLAQRYPDDRSREDGTALVTPAVGLQAMTTRRVRTGLGLLLGAVGMLLLVACLNVAHLFLARGLGRVQDMAVRRSLGASTTSLVQHLLLESLILGGLGGLLGLGLATLGLRSFMSLNPTAIPWATDVSLDWRVLGFAAAVSVTTALLFGLVPAIRSLGQDLTNDLKGTSRAATAGRGAIRIRSSLVIAEVALSLVLVASAGLLLRSFMNVRSLDPGFQPEGVWTLPLNPTGPETPAEYVESMNRVAASLAAIPGVQDATYSLTLPFERTGTSRCCWMTSNFRAEGEPVEGIRLLLQPTTSSYFETLDVPLLAGRVWTEGEAGSDPWPAVISENLAVMTFGSAARAINRVLEVGGEDSGTPVRIVGVSEDTHHFGLDQDPPTFVYLPVEKLPFDIPMAHMAVRTSGDPPPGFARTLRQAVWDASPNLPVPTVRTMDDWIDRSNAGRRFESALFGSFGTLALLLAAAGLYGTLLYTVGQRRRELGIRMALGAARRRVERQVVTQGLVLAVLGSIVGIAGAWATGRFLESRLFQLEANDPSTLIGAVLVLLGASVFASWFPARRAAGVDPMKVLREE